MVCVWNGFHFLVNIEVLEGWLAIDHLIEDAAEGPDVGGTADFETAHALGELYCLGTHVVDCANLKRGFEEAANA